MADAGSFGKVKDHIGSFGGVAVTAAKAVAVGFAAVTGAVAAVTLMSWSAVKSAEALADAQARVGLVYGAAAEQVNAAAASNANALGMTKTAYLDSAGALGQYAVNLGATQAKAAEYGATLTELAPKIAAYTGAEQGAVSDALEKALGGKTKALEAMGYHIEKAPKGLSDAAAAQFYYAQVVAQSGNAVKAWNDNAGDTDVSLARIGASFEDAKAKAGTLIAAAVAPYLKSVADAASELSAAFQAGGLDGLVAKFNELTGIDLSGWLDALQQKWADVVAAFQDGGIVAALSEIVGFDVQPLIDNAIALKDSFLAFWHDAVEPAAAFLTGTLVPAVMSVVDWLTKHKDIVFGVVAAFAAFKLAIAVQAGIAAVATALGTAQKAWALWQAGARLAALQTLGFSTALKIAAGPIGWLILAVGLLAAAWAGNWGDIREKTAAVVEWIKTIPAQLAAGWNQLKADLAAMVASWQAKWTDVKAHPVKAFGEVMAFLGTLPMTMAKKGLDIVLGLLGGLKSGWDKLVSWWKGKQGDIAGATVKHYEMKSPSKLMLKLGFWITEGLALGILAGGVLAQQAMAQTLTDLDRANAGVAGGQRVANAAKAAVEAALLADGIIKGKYESYSEAWGRYYEEMTRQETALNELNVKNIEERRKAANDLLTEQLAGAKALGEAEGIRVARLIQNQRDTEQKTGAPQQELDQFDNLWRQSAENLRSLLELLAGGPIADIDAAFRDFWVNFNGGAVSGIANSQQLTEAITALVDAVGKKYDKLFKDTEDGFNKEATSEEERHKRVIENLNQRRAFIDALIQEQEHADANLSELIAIRDALLAQAKQAIANAQKAAEEFEDRVHGGVMRAIAAERAAQTGAHKVRMIELEDERRAIDAGHERRLGQLQAERDRVTKGFEERQHQIDKEKNDIARMKLDLGVEDAAKRLTDLQEKLANLKSVMDSFKVIARGRDASVEARKAVIDRVKITSAEQRKAFEDVLASGTLNEKDTRRVQLLLLGRGSMRAEDMRRIIGASAEALQGQVDAQQQIVNFLTNQVAIRERANERAQTQLNIDKQDAQIILDGIDKRITEEDKRWTTELGRNAARITMEQQRFDAEMDFLDQLADAETARHEQRMIDIASEYALELARLGMTQSQIDAMVAAAQAEAARIAKETEDTFKRLKEAAGGGLAEAGGLGLSGAGGGGLKFPGGIGQPPGVPLPEPAPGGPIGGLRPGGEGAIVFEAGAVTADTVTADTFELGAVNVDGTQVFVTIDGKDFATQVVKTIAGDAVLLDALGKPLAERAARKAQTP